MPTNYDWLDTVFDDIKGDSRERKNDYSRDIYYDSYACGYARSKDIRNAIEEYERSNIWD